MPKRIVIHAGFHKTGTTSIQKTLRENKTLLQPNIRIVLRDGMLGLCETARGYSIRKSAWDLGMIQYETVGILQRFSGFDGTLLLSSEDLSGHMPGRKSLKSYAAMPKILHAIHSAALEVFAGANISFFFGTRAAKPWLNSCYVQHLRATRIVQTSQEYADTHKSSADLDKVISDLRNTLSYTDVISSALEDCSGFKLGPLDPLLDHLEVTQKIREQFKISPPANKAPPPAKVDRLLELNQSSLSDADVKEAKHALKKQVF